MGRQRNRPQMKEQENSPEEELMKQRQAIYHRVQSNDYKDIQQHEKRRKHHKKGPVRNK